MTRINGWRRMWLLASALWAVVVLVLAGRFQPNGAQAVPEVNMTLFALRLWITPVAAIYGLGLGFAWVRRGFQVEAK
jgi:polyferredoxin